MRRSYKFLMRPTVKQAQALRECLEDHRQIYNAALEERREAYRRAKVTIRYPEQGRQLKDIRRALPEQARWSHSSQRETLRRLDRAMEAFFRRIKVGQVPGYPRFKGRNWFDTVEWPKDGDGCRWDSTPEGTTRVYLKGVGHVRVHDHRAIRGHLKTISVKREGRRWFVVLSCDGVPPQPLPPVGASVGVDMGVVAFLTTSDGVRVPNPRHGQRNADRLAVAQQVLSRRKRGSTRRRKARQRVADLHGKVRRQRLDHAHKTALWLVRHHDVVAHEDLQVRNMTRSGRGTVEHPGTNVAQKSGLNRVILDAGWGMFLQILSDKAESAGRTVIAVNPANTSRTCPECGHCAAGNRISQADFVCAVCGYAAHADVVGAINILRAGLARRAALAA